MYCFNGFSNFIVDKFLILYNMKNNISDMLWIVIEIAVLIFVGFAGVYSLFMILSLIRGMVI